MPLSILRWVDELSLPVWLEGIPYYLGWFGRKVANKTNIFTFGNIYIYITIRHYLYIIIYYDNMKPKPTRRGSERRANPIPRSREKEREGGREGEKNWTEDRRIWKTYRCLRLNRIEMFHARRFVGDQLRKIALLDSDCSLQLWIQGNPFMKGVLTLVGTRDLRTLWSPSVSLNCTYFKKTFCLKKW
jgi:hypothetical protein